MTFSEIPSDNLFPMFFTEFDNSNAVKSGAMPWKNLLIGQPLSANADRVGKLVRISSDEQADAYYGAGSQIALMVRAFRKNSKTSELWALAVADAPDSTKAQGAIKCTVSDTLAASGTVRLMVGGQAVAVNVSAGDDSAAVATKTASAVNSKGNLPVTAAATENTVTLTAKNAGELSIDIRVNHNQGEELPTGLSVEVTAMANGGADPSYSDAKIASIIEGTWFNAIAIGSDDQANVSYIKEILDERWKATDQKTGVLFFSLNTGATEDSLSTRANALNSQVVVLLGIPESPTPGFEIAAASLGVIGPKTLNDPAAPLSNWAVAGIVAPRFEDKEGLDGNNTLLKAGVGLLTSDDSGTVYLKRIVTTYKRTANGSSDTSYQQVETVFTLSFIRWDWNNYMAGRYPHAKLADDGNDFGPGQTVMTPKLGAGELLGRYEYWMGKGLVQNYENFKANLVVVRDEDDKTALQFLIPAELVSQFFIGKSKIQFK